MHIVSDHWWKYAEYEAMRTNKMVRPPRRNWNLTTNLLAGISEFELFILIFYKKPGSVVFPVRVGRSSGALHMSLTHHHGAGLDRGVAQTGSCVEIAVPIAPPVRWPPIIGGYCYRLHWHRDIPPCSADMSFRRASG